MRIAEFGQLPRGTFRGCRMNHNTGELGKMMLQALEGHNPRRFACLCDELGIEREQSGDPELYDLGIASMKKKSARGETQIPLKVPVIQRETAELLYATLINHGYSLGEHEGSVRGCFREVYGNRNRVEGRALSNYKRNEIVSLATEFLLKCGLPAHPEVY